MKKNGGFTLIELTSVIVLIGLLAALVAIPINKMVKDSKEKSYENQKNFILLASQNWAVDNPSLLPTLDGEKRITLKELIDSGYLDTTIVNSKDKVEIKTCSYVSITLNVNSIGANQNTYQYEFTKLESC